MVDAGIAADSHWPAIAHTLTGSQHFADWQIADRISGAQGSVDDYLAWGGHIAAGLRW